MGVHAMKRPSRDKTRQALARLTQGEGAAAERLLPLVYEELRALAARYLRGQRVDHTLQPTALVHEAYVKLVDQTRPRWTDEVHFKAVAARAMRQILIDHAERQGAAKRGGGRTRITLRPEIAPSPERKLDFLELNEALGRLAALDERKANVVEARFFGGLGTDEIAHVLGLSKSTVERDWRLARAWLSMELADHRRPSP